MEPKDLKERSLAFAVAVTALCRGIQNDWAARRRTDQLFRSATSVAANYHAACRGRSRREFIAKLGVVVEEAEETVFRLRFAIRTHMTAPDASVALLQEAQQLLAIVTASAKTATANEPKRGR